MRNYSFRRLTPEDLPLMRRWLQTAHVRAWWPDTDRQLALMKNDMDNPELDMMVVSLIQHPFAYIHDHHARAFDLPQFADLPHGARVIDQFVGDPDFIGQGHAVGFIEARVRDLRRHFPMVAAAAQTTDTRTLAIYRQAGFMKRRMVPTRDGRLVQVMTHL
ncbi:GNAT family N-acetyltransferase [Yoonia sp.]|uniref:GNAT family N-acetyltransferase n=1 Tax=Yoonia sp. TaxID=2212373 RepID=UPI002FDA1F69